MSINPLDWFSPVGDLVDSIGSAIDDNVTNDEERLILRNQLVEMKNTTRVKIEELKKAYDEQITKRWESDNQHGSWLAQNIRPFTLGYLLFMVTLMAILDGNYKEFTINPLYISLFGNLLFIVFPAYFGLREIGKVASNWRKKNGQSVTEL